MTDASVSIIITVKAGEVSETIERVCVSKVRG